MGNGRILYNDKILADFGILQRMTINLFFKSKGGFKNYEISKKV